ncbi:MAG TPA: hypothetical protein DCY07_06025 [Rhodospirillaceae bacterium]|nr:hypothetical protein [Rhodospirillaceae bacterium]
MDKQLIQKAMDYFLGRKNDIDPLMEEKAAEEALAGTPAQESSESSSAMMRTLVGPVSAVGEDFFPADLIGGCCPRVVGSEQEIVWNAAAEASDSERVHVVWHAMGQKIWYLAVRSTDMSSRPNTWCPFASLLPGMKDAKEPPVIYTNFSDESATMMTVMQDGLQIHRGTTSVVRAKAERMSRELNNAPIEEMVPDRIQMLTPVPWFSLSMFEDRARRVLAAASIAAAMVISFLSIIVWFVAAMSAMNSSADIEDIQKRSEAKSLSLLKSVQEQRASPMREQLARFADVNDGLLALNGYLDIYFIERDKAVWRAILPENITSDRISELGAQTLDTSGGQGVVIGNTREALNIGRKGGKK